jgi:NADH-quinone oxidoreductase subunit J
MKLGASSSLLLAGIGLRAVAAASPPSHRPAAGRDQQRAIGIAIFTDYSLAFEATSVLILVAMVGAVVLAKKKI